MPLRPQSGNMYPFVTHTWNPIKGRCSHDCSYCYMKRFKLNPIRLDERELGTDLGEGNFIFVGSGTDMWARDVPIEWIVKTVNHCSKYPKNTYLFQTKNPGRYFSAFFAEINSLNNVIYGTTIETNRIHYGESKAPDVFARADAMARLSEGNRRMVTIEPIIDFSLEVLPEMIQRCKPEWVNIGADSKGHGLPEPPAEKVRALIEELQKFTEVKVKDNLKRLMQ